MFQIEIVHCSFKYIYDWKTNDGTKIAFHNWYTISIVKGAYDEE